MNMKAKRWLMGLALLLLLAGCGGATQSLSPAFSFSVAHRPALDLRESRLTTTLSILDRSGVGLQGTGQAAMPGYLDMEFFPVLNDAQLDTVLEGRSRFSNCTNIEPVDFSRNFVLLVAVPGRPLLPGANAGSAIYSVSPSLSYRENEVEVVLKASRLGGDDITAADTITRPWDIDAYVIAREQGNTLSIKLYDEIYRFSLENDGSSPAKRL